MTTETFGPFGSLIHTVQVLIAAAVTLLAIIGFWKLGPPAEAFPKLATFAASLFCAAAMVLLWIAAANTSDTQGVVALTFFFGFLFLIALFFYIYHYVSCTHVVSDHKGSRRVVGHPDDSWPRAQTNGAILAIFWSYFFAIVFGFAMLTSAGLAIQQQSLKHSTNNSSTHEITKPHDTKGTEN